MARGHTLFNLGKYSFASWARRGLGNSIASNGTSLVRARLPLTIALNNETLTQDLELLGPADVAHVTRNAIVRTSPLNRNFDFEWNMLPYIEFYDEDFLWRYTPDAPENGNLRPWLALFVLKADEFSELPSPRGQLSAIRLQTSALPPSADHHLWGHMHTGEFAGVTNLDKALEQINHNVKLDPDGFTCRLLSPRRLEPITFYHAFLVPSYETGRLAGLGEDFSKISARQAAWPDTDRPATLDFPVYYRWSFATSESSFEDLIARIKTASANPNVGVRPMDTSHAGYAKAEGIGHVGATNPAEIGLEGALRTPATASTPYVADGQSDDFQKDIKALLGLYNSASDTPSAYGEAKMDGDPVLTIPLYGQPYAKLADGILPILPPSRNWYTAINFDPRNRVAAALGTQVVQKHQEDLMQSAWSQLDVLQKARNNFAAVGAIMERLSVQLAAEEPVEFVSMARTMTSRVKASVSATTMFQQLSISATPNALINSATRRMIRAGGGFVQRVDPGAFTGAKPAAWLILSSVNANLNIQTIPSLRALRFDTGSVSAGVISPLAFSAPTPQWIAFNTAFQHFIRRVGSPPATFPSLVLFDFVSAKNAILSTVKTAPMRLLKARINLSAADGTADNRAPAELVGQPVFQDAMYEPLWHIAKEWFLPNLNLLENNTLTLLETNPHFIHAYMLGLNQELGREMLWRGYPADLSATFFRNFWSTGDGSQTLQVNDIEPIQKWLGAAAPPRQSSGQAARLVLTLRGDLLRKFPNTVIFMAQLHSLDGKFTFTNNSVFRFPAFRAELPPDLQFIGFDLSVSQVMENTTLQGNTEWYFIFMEPVGEPRFGLDAAFRPNDARVLTRNDLAWEHVGNGGFLTAAKKPDLTMTDMDKNLWGKDAATMAAFLFQQPFSTIIKAADLLAIQK